MRKLTQMRKGKIMDYSKLTLGELLSSSDKQIERNATAILKILQITVPKKVINFNEVLKFMSKVKNNTDTN